MEFFPDGSHVRLWNRATNAYLHADDDGVGVSLRRRCRASLNTAWVVQRVERHCLSCVLLHSAAYGRYLALAPDQEPNCHGGRRVVQHDYDEEEMNAVMWMAFRAAGGGGGADDVVVRHVAYGQGHLRANCGFRIRHTGVTVDYFDRSKKMRWTVEAIPPRPEPPVLPVPGPTQNLVGRRGLFRRRAEPVVERSRIIFCFRANELGNFDQLGAFQFFGRSVFNLRNELAFRENEPNFSGITVCARAGQYGRLTPLVIDLPHSEEDMDIFVLTTGSPAAQELWHPDVDAP